MSGATDVLTASSSSKTSESFASVEGALAPDDKPHAARPQKMSAAVAASRWVPRNPAHINGSKIRKPGMPR